VSYADHQEQVAHALHNLLLDPRPPADEETATVVLACRDQTVKAMRERLTYLAGNHGPTAQRPSVTLASLAHRPVHHLWQVVDTLPMPPVPEISPSRLLPGPAAAAAATTPDRWRAVARNLLLGTAELARADRQPWTHRSAAGWYLIGDTAATIEALLVLDDTLTTDGTLPEGADHVRMTHRLVVSHSAKLAQWFGTEDTADLATSGVRHDLGVGGGPPVTIVRDAADYAVAQRTLTALLHGQASLIRPGADQRPGLTAARALAVGQIRLAEMFAQWADDAAYPALANQFRSRIPAWRGLHVSTVRLAEIEKRRSPLLLAQQTEMVIRLRSPFPRRLSNMDLHDLNAATQELTVTLGRTLREEALRARNILALDSEDIGPPEARPMIGIEWAFTAACQRLADDPAPKPQHQPAAPYQREQLRKTLEETAIGTPPPLRRMRPSPTSGPVAPGQGSSRHRSLGM